MRMRRFTSLFGEMLLYQHQRIVTMTKVYLPAEIIRFHTIGFSDLLSRIQNSTTTVRVFRGPFISEDRSFDLNCTISCYYVERKVGTRANSALIRYYLPRLKLSSSILALARERTPSLLNIQVIFTTIQNYLGALMDTW